MLELLLFFLGAIGLTLVVVDGVIFAPVREALEQKSFAPIKNRFVEIYQNPLGFLKELTDCYQCSGVWVGWFLGWLAGWDCSQVFMAGFASSFLALLGASILNYLEAKTV